MMSYLHTKFHDNWISSFRGVAMTRFWDGRTDGWSDCTPRPSFTFGDAGKKTKKLSSLKTFYFSLNTYFWPKLTSFPEFK